MDPAVSPPAAPGAPPVAPAAPGALPPAPVVGASDDSETRRIKRENQTLRRRLDEYTAAQATAEQTRLAEAGQHKERADKLEAQLREMQAAHATVQRDALVTRLAHRYSLPEPLWSRVQGQEEADIETDIKALVALLPAPAPAPVPTGGAATTPGKGGSPALTAESVTRLLREHPEAVNSPEVQEFQRTYRKG